LSLIAYGHINLTFKIKYVDVWVWLKTMGLLTKNFNGCYTFI
jgi:hypothetical protein